TIAAVREYRRANSLRAAARKKGAAFGYSGGRRSAVTSIPGSGGKGDRGDVPPRRGVSRGGGRHSTRAPDVLSTRALAQTCPRPNSAAMLRLQRWSRLPALARCRVALIRSRPRSRGVQ